MKSVAIFFLIVASGLSASAQKIKYKDLYVLLRSKNYKDASSFLVKYLATNPEHPNANYQMGLMLEFKIGELDLLKESDKIIVRADSAILYFDKAYTLITPKDVKKHDDDYYELFKRRNLRSGKFEVILSDVQLDIEDRKKSLQTKKVDISLINTKFTSIISFYEQAQAQYKMLRDYYKDELSLSLGAVDSTLSDISSIVIHYDSALICFKEYKRLKKTFDKSASELIIISEPINDFSKDALLKTDFYAKKVKVYNFSEWGTKQLNKIKENKAIIDHLIEFDASLENLASKIQTDSVDLTSEVFSKITSPTLKEIKLLDPESLMIDIFQYKISQLNYSSSWMSWHTLFADTLDVGLQLDFIEKLKSQHEGVSKLEGALHDYDESIFMIRYHRLSAERYAGKEELFNYVNNQAALVKKQSEDIVNLLEVVQESDKWGYWNQDSISIVLVNDPSLKYSTFYSDSVENRSVQIAGLTKQSGKNAFFFGTIPSSRMIDSLFIIEIPLEAIDLNSTDFINQMQRPTLNNLIYLLGAVTDEKYHLELVYYHYLKGVVWNTSITLDTFATPLLNYTNNQVEIAQGDIISKYQVSDGNLISPPKDETVDKSEEEDSGSEGSGQEEEN